MGLGPAGVVVLGRRAIGQEILSTITTAKGISALLLQTTNQKGKATAGGASTITLASGSSAIEGMFEGWTVEITGGTGIGQVRTISGYVGSTLVATVSVAWKTVPDNTSTYILKHPCGEVTAKSALISCETAAVLVCINGATPTVAAGTNIGMTLAAGATWALDNIQNVKNFKCINSANASGSVVKIITFA